MTDRYDYGSNKGMPQFFGKEGEPECSTRMTKHRTKVLDAIFQEILETILPSDDQSTAASLKRKADILLLLFEIIFDENEIPSALGELFAKEVDRESNIQDCSRDGNSCQKEAEKNVKHMEGQNPAPQITPSYDANDSKEDNETNDDNSETDKPDDDIAQAPKKRKTKYRDFYGDMSGVYRNPKMRVKRKRSNELSPADREAYEIESTCSSSTDDQASIDGDGTDRLLVQKLMAILLQPSSKFHQQLVLNLLHSDQNLMSLFLQERAKLGKMKIPVFRTGL